MKKIIIIGLLALSQQAFAHNEKCDGNSVMIHAGIVGFYNYEDFDSMGNTLNTKGQIDSGAAVVFEKATPACMKKVVHMSYRAKVLPDGYNYPVWIRSDAYTEIK